MFIWMINVYCDYMIKSHQFIKRFINLEPPLESYILSLTKTDAFEFIQQYNKSKIKLYPTRKDRYFLYKKLKGKDSPVTLYSYGQENDNTQKCLIIEKKNE